MSCPRRSTISRDLPCVPKTSTFLFFEQLCQKLTDCNNCWYVKSWENLTWTPYRFVHLTCQMLPLYLGKSKKSHFQHYYSYNSDYLRYLRSCTTALAVYLLMFSASYYMHSPITASGASYRRSALIWTCCGLQHRLVATWAEFQHRWCTMQLISVKKIGSMY